MLQGQKWVFGGTVRGDKTKCFIEFVENKTRGVLIEVIKRRIAPGSIIMSDCWRGYTNLPSFVPEYNFSHFTINHSCNFLDPNDPNIHTQSIEAFWSVLKRKLRKKGTNKGKELDMYFGEFLYRRQLGENDDYIFDCFINDIVNLYY